MVRTRLATCFFSSLAAIGLLLLTTGNAQAALSITNGDFETGAGSQLPDVTDWFDYDSAAPDNAWWQQTSQDNNAATSPFAPSASLFMTDATATQNNFAYQNIGTKDAGANNYAQVSLDLATVRDQGLANQSRVLLSIWQDDGSYAGGADNVDIAGAAGVNLIASASVLQVPPLNGADSDAVDGSVGPQAATRFLDISSANTTNDLYLRISKTDGPDAAAGGRSWTAIDNVTIAQTSVPEPAAVALLLTGILGLGFVRRRR